VNFTMVGAAERHRILVADFAAQGPRLHEAQVMGLGGLPLAPKGWLRRHELQMGAIAIAARLAQGQNAFVDMPDDGESRPTGGKNALVVRLTYLAGGAVAAWIIPSA
jgi:hypothetical protein